METNPSSRAGVVEDVRDFDGLAGADGAPGGPASLSDPQVAEEPGGRLGPVVGAREAEQGGIIVVAQEDGGEGRADDGRDAGEGDAVDLDGGGGREKGLSDLLGDLELAVPVAGRDAGLVRAWWWRLSHVENVRVRGSIPPGAESSSGFAEFFP
jgi:hypothetical protein